MPQLKRIEVIDILKRLEYMDGMAKQLTFAQVVQALGGVEGTAALFGVGETAVYNWLKWKRFPRHLLLQADRECQARGLNYDPQPAARRA